MVIQIPLYVILWLIWISLTTTNVYLFWPKAEDFIYIELILFFAGAFELILTLTILLIYFIIV